MSFVEALEVAEPKSPASTRTVFKPRSCASNAQPAPEAPPPITQTSYEVVPILPTISDLCCIFLTRDAIGSARCSPGSEEHLVHYRQLRLEPHPQRKLHLARGPCAEGLTERRVDINPVRKVDSGRVN